ncbi:restriction endonuclease [Nocardia takedensis]
MSADGEAWQTYEQVAAYLLNQMADKFGLAGVSGKEKLAGKATNWQIDAKGVRLDGSTVVIECKRRSRAVNQTTMAGIAWTIKDLGASGGIVVSHMGLQRGAKLIAQASNIVEVRLSADATPAEFMLQFLNRTIHGVADFASFTDNATVIVVDDGTNQQD